MIGFPLSFRALIKTVSPDNILFSYLIFPFTYSFVFFLGFYNFCIALIFLLITLNYWLNNEENFSSIKNIFKLFLLVTLTYFSHIFVFGILMLLIGLHISIKIIIQLIENSNQTKRIIIDFFRKFGVLLLSAFIPLLLFSFYCYSRRFSESDIYINHTELIDWLKNIRPIIAFNFMVEEAYTKKIFYLILSICLIVIYNRVNEIKLNKGFSFRADFLSVIKSIIKVSDFWLFTSIIILLLYFILPDSAGAGGFVSERVGLLFFLFLIIWTSTQHLQKWFILLIIGIVLYFNFKLNIYYSSEIKNLNKVAIECNDASKYILSNSVILPLNYSDNWQHEHFSNYLGIDKPMVILENYECATGYFPLKWNEKSIPNAILSNISLNDNLCLQWKRNTQNPPIIIDYVFILGDMEAKTDSCDQIIKQNLFKYYTLIYRSEICKLYKNKYK